MKRLIEMMQKSKKPSLKKVVFTVKLLAQRYNETVK